MSDQTTPARLAVQPPPIIKKICACGCGLPVRSRNRAAQYRRGHRARSQFGSPESRFWANVVMGNGCWLWQGRPSGDDGYGTLWVVDRTVGAHRFSWELHNGPIPDELHVLHRCDVRLCVNPTHLFLGTMKDNMADKLAKGRQAKGEAHGCAKLEPQQVSDIRVRRTAGEKLKSIAADHGVSPDLVCKIAKGKLWKHLGKE